MATVSCDIWGCDVQQRPIDVLFVCLHGSAKSVIAAEHLRRLARARGLSVEAESAGLEPDDSIPAHVVAGLAADGIAIGNRRPERYDSALLASSCLVVAFGCDPAIADSSRSATRWDDVPAVSDGYAAARDVIVAHVAALVEDMVLLKGPEG